jgi:hypothetical protein
VRRKTDRGFDPLSTPRWRLEKRKSVYPHKYWVNALDVSGGADGVRPLTGELLLFPKKDYTQAVFALLERVA